MNEDIKNIARNLIKWEEKLGKLPPNDEARKDLESKIESVTLSLTFDEMMEIDTYIMNKALKK